MKMKTMLALFAGSLLLLSSCDDATEDIGSSLTGNSDQLTVSTSEFAVLSHSVSVGSVVSKSSVGYLGRIKDPETGAYVTGDFMTQFNCLENMKLTPKDSVASRDADGEVVADSCEVRLFYTNYYGDSLATMKLTVYELDHPMLETQSYYSNFSPLDEGYVRDGGLAKAKAYSLVNTSELKDKTDEDEYVNNICVRLNDEYTGKDGVTYNNFGTYVLRQYYTHPEYFKNSYHFIKNVLPGMFFKITGGLGSMAYVRAPQLNIYFRKYVNGDSISNQLTLFSGTEEILQTTTVTNDEEAIANLVSDNSCTYIKSPSGIFTELTLPVDEIMQGHENDTINTARITLHRINNYQWSDYTLPSPSTLMMVETDSVKNFFENSKVANNKQSFLASLSTSSNSYTFYNISGVINAMYSAKTAGMRSDPNWVANHPNWNKVLVLPVSASYTSYNSSQILTEVTNDMTLTSTRLVGGTTPLTISVIYSKFE